MTIVTAIIEATPVRGEASHPLWRRHPGQSHPQKAYLALDCQAGYAWCGYNPNDAIPIDVHGHFLYWSVNAYQRADNIGWLMDQCRPLLQAIVDGYASRWNGSNYSGTYTDAAQAAIDAVGEICSHTFDLVIDTCDSECRVCWGDDE